MMNMASRSQISRLMRRIGGGDCVPRGQVPLTRNLSLSSKVQGDVDISLENGIRKIVINRPAKRNALTAQMYEGMTACLAESSTDNLTKIILITGSGDFFTSGNDIASLMEAFQKQTPILEMGFAKFTRGLIDCKKPIVALVNGHAVGIGVTMLPHCETVYSTDKATFTTPFIKLGIPPECCSSYLLPKTMGQAKAGELLHFNATLSAQEAYAGNLITRVIPADQFEAEALERVRKMAEFPLKSLVYSKELLRGAERQLLHDVHKRESAEFDLEVVAQAAMQFMAKQKKK